MSNVPAYGSEIHPPANTPVGITVWPLSENKAPCGFVWPTPPKPKKRPPRKSGK